jgi:hypothetical protein
MTTYYVNVSQHTNMVVIKNGTNMEVAEQYIIVPTIHGPALNAAQLNILVPTINNPHMVVDQTYLMVATKTITPEYAVFVT